MQNVSAGAKFPPGEYFMRQETAFTNRANYSVAGLVGKKTFYWQIFFHEFEKKSNGSSEFLRIDYYPGNEPILKTGQAQ